MHATLLRFSTQERQKAWMHERQAQKAGGKKEKGGGGKGKGGGGVKKAGKAKK